MKTLQQILDEKAKENGFNDWEDFISRSWTTIELRTKIVSSAALEYAEQESKAFVDFVGDPNVKGSELFYQELTKRYHSEEFKKFKEGK